MDQTVEGSTTAEISASLDHRQAKKLRDAYYKFWSRVFEIAAGRAIRLAPENFEAELQNGTVVIRASPWFHGLSTRSQGGGEKTTVDVYLQIEQTIRGFKDGSTDAIRLEISRSTIRLQYVEHRSREQIRKELKKQIDAAYAFHGIHFDYTCPGEKNHPYYHAQLEHRCIPAAEIHRRYTSAAQLLKRCDTPRIPTPPMDFPSVVYVLLHDHLQSIVEKGWPPKLLEAKAELPAFDSSPFSAMLAERAHLECGWWYGHAGETPPPD